MYVKKEEFKSFFLTQKGNCCSIKEKKMKVKKNEFKKKDKE